MSPRWSLERCPLRDAGGDWDGFPGAFAPNFRCAWRDVFGRWLDWIVEREGVIKFLTVRDLVSGQLRRSGLFKAKGIPPCQESRPAASFASMPLLRSFGFWRIGIYKYVAPLGLRKASLAGR